ncbi:hypothetical protein ACWCL1_08095 [Ligilactobacillus sp. LYQ135]
MANRKKSDFCAGNKLSLRSTAMKQIKRINSISKTLGGLGDLLTSTFESIILSIVVLAVLIIAGFYSIFGSTHFGNVKSNIFPFILLCIAAVIIALNVLMINPSQGSQAIVSFKYWAKEISGEKHIQELQKISPYRFYKHSLDKSILESRYKKHRHYIAIFRVQGSVSRTSFDEDLIALRNLNESALESMDRNTTRTTINLIETPKIQPKKVADNATPSMITRNNRLNQIIDQLGDVQTLESYIILDSRNVHQLKKEINNHLSYFSQGLVVTAKLLKGNELKQTINKLFG